MKQTYMLPVVGAGMTKTQIQAAASAAVENLIENGNIVEAVEAMSVMENYIKTVKDHNQYLPLIRIEIEKYGKGLVTASGAKIDLAEVGTKYDYSNCNDSLLAEMLIEAETMAAKIKARQDMLKTVSIAGMDLLIGDEVVKVYPPSKKSTSSVKVTLAK